MLKDPVATRNNIVRNLQKEIEKTGLSKVLIGLSGGADSALAADIAVEAVGRENVKCVFMPSIHTTAESIELAQRYAGEVLGVIDFKVLPIKDMHVVGRSLLIEEGGYYYDQIDGVPDENLQAHIRGMILMTLANIDNRLVLATGNRSEALMGYCTMYGDTVGFREVIGGLFKTEVYQVLKARYEEHPSEALWGIIERAPSAELSPMQRDIDSLPPYNILDPVLNELIGLVDLCRISQQEWIVTDSLVEKIWMKLGTMLYLKFADCGLVSSILKTVRANAWKMQQCPPTISIEE